MPPPRDKNPHKNNSLRDFQGVNTQAYRTVIGDNQFAWLEGIMPVGFGNMPVVPGPAQTAISAWPSAIYSMKSVNINGSDYEIGFGLNGSAYAVNLVTDAVTTIAAASTFSGTGTMLAQWENSQIVFVDPSKGYFTWDGTTLTKWNGTIQSLTVTAIGTGYTSQPTIGGFSSGGGSGGSATCDIQVGAAQLASGGTGYIVGSVLTIAGGTAVQPATIEVSAVNGSGAITGFNVTYTGDYTAAPTNPASVTGGYGTGATFTLNFGIGPVKLTAMGSGYTSAPAITVTGGGGTGGAITANLSVVPSGGTAVATYAGRVWVASNRTIVFSAPESFNDFTSANAGGSFVMVDETLHSNIVQLLSANNFLYIIGVSSVNVVGDVSIVSGQTVFSNTNISASIGSSQPYSVVPYYRGIWMAAPYGFYATYGSTTQKASDDLDGVYNLIDSTQPITAGVAVINKILTLCFLFKYDDQIQGARPLLAIFFNKKWFFDTQRTDLTFVDSAVVQGVPTLYGTNGTSLYKLFADASESVVQTIVTKLWDMGDPLTDKRSLKFGLELVNPSAPQIITGTIDTEISSNTFPFSLAGGNEVTWINNSGAAVSWVNSFDSTVEWLASGYAMLDLDVQTHGKYLGVTLKGSSAGTIYSGLHLQYVAGEEW